MADVRRAAQMLILRVRSGRERYASLFSPPGAAAFFAGASVARLGVAMTGLGLLWTVQSLTGSFALAGLATGTFAAGEAVAGPQLARLVDRFGQTRTVPLLLAGHLLGLASVVAGCLSDSVPVLIAGAVVAGGSLPQPGALSAARWTHLLTDRDRLRTAFSLEAAVNDVVFLAGPPAVTLASGLIWWGAGTVGAAGLLVAGCVVLVAQRRTAPPARARDARAEGAQTAVRRSGGGFVSRRLVSTLGVVFGLGCFFGAAPIVVTAFTAQQGYAPAAGVIVALTSLASLVSGLAYGAIRVRRAPSTVQALAAVTLLASVMAAALAPVLPVIVLALLVAGTTIAPVHVTSTQLVETTVPRHALTRGFTWINTASASGIAAGGALCGVVVQAAGVQTALVACSALIAVAPVSALLGVRGSRASDAIG
ncbi:MFS transporter [Herbiconiux daphne]|uniref:MFS transporter n=1 Tax=Herbiconiux daphne TaxID=2970914 RepID=A0ABT2GZR1_9MICO|nr:MFS transporter [Herbiconiux daphne]MCS5732179.1 MFS transporter [Herbiconiux daphne]